MKPAVMRQLQGTTGKGDCTTELVDREVWKHGCAEPPTKIQQSVVEHEGFQFQDASGAGDNANATQGFEGTNATGAR